ncbi:MAG: radical SAM protein [Helicobacteraceae bacterium]|jgi:nitrogen fixation protein NifB|nr:radical SAM protein [Helicobacteraceae bacterium]
MDFANHPCFNSEARHRVGRIHLPVARKCNVQCNFCNRKYDCVNESRPGVTSMVLTPAEAASYLEAALAKIPNIAVVGIAGPGDPFADPEETLKTMELVGEKKPGKILCLATNGLGILEYVNRVAELNVSHVTITLNAVDPEIGAKIYSWIRFGTRVYRGAEGAKLLLSRQTEAIRALKSHGITVKINTVVIPRINDFHVEEIASYAVELGADVQNCIPMMHVEDTPFENITPPSRESVNNLRKIAGGHIAQMSHCARCRADAAGLLSGTSDAALVEKLLAEATIVRATPSRPFVAAASMEGLLVNRHLGEATGVWIFGLEEKGITLKGRRSTPPPGLGDTRWERLADTLRDCAAILVSNCGQTPKRILESKGVRVVAAEGLISEAAGAILEGRAIPKILMTRAGNCGAGASCGGTGGGCG